MEEVMSVYEKELIPMILGNSERILSFIKKEEMNVDQTALVLTVIVQMNKEALREALTIRTKTLLLEKEHETYEAQNRLLRFEIEQLRKAVGDV